jgi:hypothetical protein
MVLPVGAATKLRLAIYLPLLGIAVLVLVLRSGAFAYSEDYGPPPKPPGPITEWTREPAQVRLSDGNRHQFSVAGEYDFFVDRALGSRLQWRLSEVRGVVVLDSVATKINGWTVEIDAFDRLYLEGGERRLKNGYWLNLGKGSYVVRRAYELVIHWQIGSRWVEFSRRGLHWSISRSADTGFQGLIGISDQLPRNRLIARNGRVLGPATRRNTKRFYRSWRVPDGESLLGRRRAAPSEPPFAYVHTVDLSYPLEEPGVFDAAISKSTGARIQVRYKRFEDRPVFDRLATRMDGHLIEVNAAREVWIDGRRTRVSRQGINYDDGTELYSMNDIVYLSWRGKNQERLIGLQVSKWDWVVNAYVSGIRGLVGGSGGKVITRGGRTLGRSPAEIERFAESWRVPKGESLFTDRAHP